MSSGNAAAKGEYVSPYTSHEEAVKAYDATDGDILGDIFGGIGGGSCCGSGAVSAAQGGSRRHVQNPSIAANAPVPDHVYALMNVTGDGGSCSTSGQCLNLAGRSYLTAELAAADAVSAFHNPNEDPDYAEMWSPPYESDYRNDPDGPFGPLLGKPYAVSRLHPLRFWLTRGHRWGAPTPLKRGVGTPHQFALGLAASYLSYADVCTF